MEAFIGTILPWPMNWAPNGWALCNGATLPISQWQAVFALIGTTYGGNGTTNFQLPNLQGRTMVGYGNGLGLTPRDMGEIAGTENASILIGNMPSHTHVATFTPGGAGSSSLLASPNGGNSSNPAGNYLANGTDTSGTLSAPTQNYVTPAAAGTPAAIAGLNVTGGAGTVAVQPAGGNTPLGIMPPFLVVNFIFCMIGIFPSRG